MQQGAARFKQLNRVVQQVLLLAAFALSNTLNALGLPPAIRDLIFVHGGDQWSGVIHHFFQLLVTRTDEDIKAAAREWCLNPVLALAEYGHISCWNVSPVTDMARLFHNQRNFNDDISRWDVANVQNMCYMFCGASKFNQNVSSWKVADVENMSSMFDNASSFNQNVSSWDVANVEKMISMFGHASSFNQDLNGWAVSADTKTTYMFNSTGSLRQKPRWYEEDDY